MGKLSICEWQLGGGGRMGGDTSIYNIFYLLFDVKCLVQGLKLKQENNCFPINNGTASLM